MNPLEFALRQPWMARLGWTLVHFLWQGTAIAAAYGVVRVTGGRLLSARGRYALACAALAALAAAPPITFLATANNTSASTTPAGLTDFANTAWERALPWVVIAWGVGVALFSARLIGGWWVVARVRRVAVSAPPADWREALDALIARMRVALPVHLLVSGLASTPTVIGWLRPVILIPVEALTGMPEDHIRALLAHELAHILRRDYLVNILQSVAEAALFYHPAVWWISAQIRAERESCCDDLAVEATGDLVAYACALTNLDSHRRSSLRLATAANGGSLVCRIRRLLGQPDPPSHALPNPAAILALSLLWLAGMGAVLAHGANSPAVTGLPTAHRTFVPPPAAAASAQLPLPTPPAIRSAGPVSLVAALLFDPFLAPLPQTPPPDDAKKPATVSGTVVSTSGTPIAGASAALDAVRTGRPPSGPQPQRQVAVSDATGKFTFANVPPGTYQFSVSHQVYLNPRNLKTEAFGPLPPSRLTLTADQHIDDLAIKLVEPATLTGRTVDEDGDPVARADVSIIRRVYSAGRRALEEVAVGSSGDNGEFKISGLAPGRYILKADKGILWNPNPAHMGYFGSRPPRSSDVSQAPIPAARPGTRIYNPASTWYGGSDTEAGATPIDISPGQNIPLGVIKMGNRAIVHVRGKVVGDAGLLADARVVQLQPDDIMWNYGSGDAGIKKDGSFDLPNIRPANQVLIVARSKQGGILAWTRINVGQEDVQGVLLNASTAPMNGTVRFEGEETANKPGTPIQVFLTSIGTPAFINYQPVINKLANVNSDGSFTILNVPPGSYTIGVGLPDGSYLKSARLAGIALSDQQVEWKGPASGPLELIASSRAAAIEGTLLDENGQPARGTVTLVPDVPRPAVAGWYPSATTGAQGSFRFPSVPPGTYKLYAWEEIEATAHWDPDYIRPFGSSGQSIEVREGGHATVTVKRISAPAMRDALRKAGIL